MQLTSQQSEDLEIILKGMKNFHKENRQLIELIKYYINFPGIYDLVIIWESSNIWDYRDALNDLQTAINDIHLASLKTKETK